MFWCYSVKNNVRMSSEFKPIIKALELTEISYENIYQRER